MCFVRKHNFAVLLLPESFMQNDRLFPCLPFERLFRGMLVEHYVRATFRPANFLHYKLPVFPARDNQVVQQK